MKFGQFAQNDYLWMLKHSRIEMKYYSQYRSHDLFELQESLSGLSKSNYWVKLADLGNTLRLGAEIEQE
ncbi:hypothetical protein [Hoylesella buccalis]|uniref:hypothetical protein n=1 Tax=Hoylesella buccalis TaxID=28127 RepID=UPI003995405A